MTENNRTGSGPVPEGYYTARAVTFKDDNGQAVFCKWGKTSTDKVQIGMMFEIIDDCPYKGRRLPWRAYFTDAAWERTVESLEHCGFNGNDLDNINRYDLSNEVSIDVRHEQWEDKDGKTQSRVSVAFVNASGGIAMKDELSYDEVKAFAASLQARINGRRASRGGGRGGGQRTTQRHQGPPQGLPPGYQPPPQQDGPPPPGDDDIPF